MPWYKPIYFNFNDDLMLNEKDLYVFKYMTWWCVLEPGHFEILHKMNPSWKENMDKGYKSYDHRGYNWNNYVDENLKRGKVSIYNDESIIITLEL